MKKEVKRWKYSWTTKRKGFFSPKQRPFVEKSGWQKLWCASKTCKIYSSSWQLPFGNNWNCEKWEKWEICIFKWNFIQERKCSQHLSTLSPFHNLYNFHFSFEHMMGKMQKFIFCPDLENIILDMIKSCPVCTLRPDKKLFRQCGRERSTVYRPLQCIVIDSIYLPSDRFRNGKALILAYLIIYYVPRLQNS